MLHFIKDSSHLKIISMKYKVDIKFRSLEAVKYFYVYIVQTKRSAFKNLFDKRL